MKAMNTVLKRSCIIHAMDTVDVHVNLIFFGKSKIAFTFRFSVKLQNVVFVKTSVWLHSVLQMVVEFVVE